MKWSSLRQSPLGSTAAWCHWSRRWVLVKLPSFSVWAAQGKKKTSVLMSSGRTSPRSISGASRQKLGGLGDREVAHHQPVELAHALALEGAVHGADRRVLAHA